jgi:hypothetical protein
MTTVRRFLLLTVLAATAAGCATTKAKAPVAPLALEVPPPPGRVIVPPEPDPPPPAAAPEPEARTQKPTRTRAAAPRPDPRADAKGTAAKPETPPVADTSKPASTTASGTVTLQQELPASPDEMVRRVRQQLDQAKGDLGRVNYGALNADGKSQYDTAKRFIEQADQALKDKNVVLAGKLAEKAASLAAVVGR